MAVRNKKIIEEALIPEDYVYTPPERRITPGRWETESQYNAHSVDEDFMAKMQEAERRGDFASAAYWEKVRNEKIGLGYGGQYSPTYKYNYNPSDNKAKADDIRERLMEYDKFDYDPQNDAAYKALTNVYHKNAKAASENALARAAAANGGRLSSNAIIAANLGYQDKMAGLEAEIPQLRQAAYNMFRDEKNDLRQLGYDYENAEDANYSRWADEYSRLVNSGLNARQEQRLDSQEGRLDRQEQRYDNQEARLDRQEERTDKLNERTFKAQDFSDALSLSQNLGYVTDGLSALTGVPANTPFNSTKEFLTMLQYNTQSTLGKFEPEWLAENGMSYNEDGTTLGTKELNYQMSKPTKTTKVTGTTGETPQYNPYADQTQTSETNQPETQSDIVEEVAEPTSEQKINDAYNAVKGSSNPVDEILKLQKNGTINLTDKELVMLYSMI